MIRILKIGEVIYENFEEKTYVAVDFDEEGNPTKFQEVWTIPTDLEALKSVAIDTIKWLANVELRKTDWVAIKCAELKVDPAEEYSDVVTKRQAIRDWSNKKEQEVRSAQSFEELLEVIRDLRIPDELSR